MIPAPLRSQSGARNLSCRDAPVLAETATFRPHLTFEPQLGTTLVREHSRFCRGLVLRMLATLASLAVLISRLLCAMGIDHSVGRL